MGCKYGLVTSLNIFGKSLKNVQNHSLTKFLQVKKQTSYIVLLLKTKSLPAEIMAMERVVEYMFKVQKVPHIDFLEFHGKQANISKRCTKAKFCVPVGYKIWENGLVDGMQHTCFMMHH